MEKSRYSYEEDWDEIYRNQDSQKPWLAAGVSSYLQDYFNDTYKEAHADDAILDIGCGDGTLCRYLSKKGFLDVQGIDASKFIIGQCQKFRSRKKGLSFKRKNIVTGSFANGKRFDTVVCWLLLHHIRPEDLDSVVRNIALLCRRGGTVHLSYLIPDSGKDGERDRDSLFTTAHRVTFYADDMVASLFSPYFEILQTETQELGTDGVGGRFPYRVIRMQKKDTREDWIKDLQEFKISTAEAEQRDFTKVHDKLMKFLVDFSLYATKKDKLLPQDDFTVIFDKLFRTVSRFITQRLLDSIPKEEKERYVVILKMNGHLSNVVYSATQYSKNEKGEFRPHSRFKSKASKYVKSRAYDLFLAYEHFLHDNPQIERFTLQHHFALDPSLKYFSFSYPPSANPQGIVVDPPERLRDFKRYKNYVSFLEAMFVPPKGDTDYDSFVKQHYPELLSNHNRFPMQSFSCYNLGIPGFESWGTLMVESRGTADIKSWLLYKLMGDEKETELLLDIKNLVFILKGIEYDYYDKYFTNDVRTQAVKAAIAQVMARNMSHNIGSHVYSNLLGKDVEDVCRNDVTGSYHSAPLFESTPDRSVPQLAFFNRYMKARMDYLSEITFGVSDLFTTKRIYGDVMKELDSVRVLLNHIAGVANFNYRFDLFHGQEKLCPSNDIGAAFPNDILGCQAFYNIIENVIRNTAKHHFGKTNERPVTFTIRFKDIENPYTRGIVKDADGLYCVEIDDGLPKEDIDDLVLSLNHLLNKPVLDKDTNNLRGTALGLLEMKASAAFLRQISMVDTDSDDYRFTDDDSDYHRSGGVCRMVILKAFKTKDEALGYRFFMQKPKEFLLVGDSWGENRPDLRSSGIQIIEPKSFLEDIRNKTAFAHPFLVYDNARTERFILRSEVFIKRNDCKTLLPVHVLRDDDNVFHTALKRKASGGESVLEAIRRVAWDKLVSKDVRISTNLIPRPDVVLLKHGDGFFQHYDSENRDILFDALSSRSSGKLPQFDKYSQGAENIDTVLIKYLSTIGEIRKDIQKDIYNAYRNGVIIIDERVQKFAEENVENSYPCWDLFEASRVLIPRAPVWDDKEKCFKEPQKVDFAGIVARKVDLDFVTIPLAEHNVLPLSPASFDEKIAYKVVEKDKEAIINITIGEKLIKYINESIGLLKKLDKDAEVLLLIHYGILERIYSTSSPEEREKKVSALLTSLADKATRVVVTSGRGAHSLSLPDSVCFVNLSSVLYACIENRNKYLINYLLTQSRRKRDE